MPYKRFKDESDLIAKFKINAERGYYFHVFLWASQNSFDVNTCNNAPGEAAGCCNLAPSILMIGSDGSEVEIIRKKLGEVHFIKGKWTLEIVAHELCHALIQRLRMIEPSAEKVIEQTGDSEEIICYEFGRWVDSVYRLLWKHDAPNQKLKQTD